MNETDRMRFQKRLLEFRDRLAGELRRMSETVRSDAQPPGEHDHGVSESIEKEILLESAEDALQRQVCDALRRIEEGTYGQCQACGGRITKERLNAVPYTAYCIACERDHERE